MIQQVFLSGQLGRAIYTQGDQRLVLSVDAPTSPRLCTGRDAGLFFESGAEYSLLPSVKGLDQLATSLDRETRCYTALNLVLSSIDPDLIVNRELNLEAAEELLEDEAVQQFIRRRLLARSLPESTDIDKACADAGRAGAARMHALLITVQECQPAIKVLSQAWGIVAAAFFLSEHEALDTEISLIESGVLEEIVSALQCKEYEKLNAMVVGYGADSQLAATVPRASHLLNTLKNQVWLLAGYAPGKKKAAREKQVVAKGRKSTGELVSHFDETKEHRSSRPLSGYAAKARVDIQIEAIARQIREHNIPVAEKWLRDLVEFHVQRSEKEHLAKSLCAVATIALENHEPGFSEVLVGHAVSLGVEDPVVFSLKARILSNTGRHKEALAEYEDAIRRFGDDAYAYNGRAEVLKAIGRFDEALAAFDHTIRQFPDNVVAYNGRAEVLKAMGRFDEGLAAFDHTIHQFPNDAVAHTGRAEALKALGRFDEALVAFDHTIRQFPDNVVAYTGRAEVLKATGRFDEALVAFDHTIRRFPDNEVVHNGRAEVLKAMGRFDDALAAFDQIIRQFPSNEVAHNGRAEVLKAMGRFDDALAAFDQTISQFPNDAFARTGRAEVLKAMGRFDDALATFDQTIRQFPNNAVAHNGRAEVLKAMGRFDEALSAYKQTRALFLTNQYAMNGYASVLLLLDRIEEVKTLLPPPEKDPASHEDWVLYHIGAMMYLKSGEVDEAINRLSHGAQHAPWHDVRSVFINALAVALIKKQEFKNALNVLQRDMNTLDAIQRQKRLVLIGHSHAAIGQRQEAVKNLSVLSEAKDPNVISLRDFLQERYSLVEQPNRTPPSNLVQLDFQIAQKEFLLVQAA